MRIGHLEQLFDAVRLLRPLGAVEEVDRRPRKVGDPRHAEKRGDADTAGDPDLTRVPRTAMPEPAERALHARVGGRLELLQLSGVIAERLDQEAQVVVLWRGRDRVRVRLPTHIATVDRQESELSGAVPQSPPAR